MNGSSMKCFGAMLSLCLLLAACSSQELTPEQKALTELKWDYTENAIELSFTADKDLNQYDGQAHNLLVVVTQFDQISAFSAYTGSSQQLSSLLLMNSAPTGMIGLTRLFIEPGQIRQLSLPRLEGAKMVGIAVATPTWTRRVAPSCIRSASMSPPPAGSARPGPLRRDPSPSTCSSVPMRCCAARKVALRCPSR